MGKVREKFGKSSGFAVRQARFGYSRYSTVEYVYTVQYFAAAAQPVLGTVQYSTVQYRVQYSTVQYRLVYSTALLASNA